MKNTITALLIAVILMIASIVTMLLNNTTTAMIIMSGITIGILSQTALSRIEKRTGIYHGASIALNLIASVVIDSFLHEERVTILFFCFFMSSMVSILYLYFKKHEKSLKMKKVVVKKNSIKTMTNTEEVVVGEEVVMGIPLEKSVGQSIDRRGIFAS